MIFHIYSKKKIVLDQRGACACATPSGSILYTQHQNDLVLGNEMEEKYRCMDLTCWIPSGHKLVTTAGKGEQSYFPGLSFYAFYRFEISPLFALFRHRAFPIPVVGKASRMNRCFGLLWVGNYCRLTGVGSLRLIHIITCLKSMCSGTVVFGLELLARIIYQDAAVGVQCFLLLSLPNWPSDWITLSFEDLLPPLNKNVSDYSHSKLKGNIQSVTYLCAGGLLSIKTKTLSLPFTVSCIVLCDQESVAVSDVAAVQGKSSEQPNPGVNIFTWL